MTNQPNLYLLKHRGIPVKIFPDEDIPLAIASINVHYSYRRISFGEASLLGPAIQDYVSSIGNRNP